MYFAFLDRFLRESNAVLNVSTQGKFRVIGDATHIGARSQVLTYILKEKKTKQRSYIDADAYSIPGINIWQGTQLMVHQ